MSELFFYRTLCVCEIEFLTWHDKVEMNKKQNTIEIARKERMQLIRMAIVSKSKIRII